MSTTVVPPPRSIAVVLQGPIHTNLNGRATRDILEALQASPVRERLYVVCSVWDDEPADRVDALRPYVDLLVSSPKPAEPGTGNRNYQRHGVRRALDALPTHGIEYVLKTRTDFLLSDRFLGRLVSLADVGFERVLVTNLYTRYEAFHISDLLVFSSRANIETWFDTRDVYYQDLYSPEVEFARVFVRNRGLPYSMTLESYFRFLRDWVEIVDVTEEGLVWFKFPWISRRAVNRGNGMLLDRDSGPLLSRLVRAGFPRFLRRTGLPLSVMATALLVADPWATIGLLGLHRLLERVLRIRPHYKEIDLPGGYQLTMKLGFEPRRHAYYQIDPKWPEYAKPIDGRLDAAPAVGSPPAPAPTQQPGGFRVALRRKPRAGHAPRPS